jgi:hypothetical protein
MPPNEAEALRISRRLTPEHRADLLAWVRLAYAAENAVRKTLTPVGGDISNCKSREYSRENTSQRRKR